MATKKRRSRQTRKQGATLAPQRLNVANGALFASEDGVGIGTATPKTTLDVTTTAGGFGPVANVVYAGTEAVDKIAVRGVSVPKPDFGTGGSFIGGTAGIIARSEARGGIGERVGGEFWAQCGRATYGIKASTFGSPDHEAGIHIAGFFHADREQNHGEFWAGFFLGRIFVSENVGIGTREPAEKLDVHGNVRVSGAGHSVVISEPAVPSHSGDPSGVKGQIAWDDGFLYVKTEAGERHVWKRVELKEW
jgi:hypothetical protein